MARRRMQRLRQADADPRSFMDADERGRTRTRTLWWGAWPLVLPRDLLRVTADCYEVVAGALPVLLVATLIGWGTLVPLRSPQTMVAQAILLSPAVAEAPGAARARGVFLTTNVKATMPATVVLASSPDGAGALCTDDQATLTFSKSGRRQVWTHLFASADRRGITCLPPQTLQLAAGAGEYEIAVTLEDRFAPTYRSRSYYYLVFAVDATVDEHAPPTRVAATVAPTRVAATASQTVAPSPTAPVSAIPTTVPLATTAQRRDEESKGRAASLPPWGNATTPYFLVAVVALVALAAFALLRRRRPQTKRMGGIVDLFDRETGEGCTLLLHRFPTGVGIARFPLQATALLPDNAERLVAEIVPGARQPQLKEGGDDVGAALTAGERLLVAGVVEVEYRQA